MTPKETRNEKLARRMIKNLEHRNFEAFYCATAAEAVEKVSTLIPDGSSVTWGGSMTIREIGLTEALHTRKLRVLDRDRAANSDEVQRIYREAFSADYYLSSANAISEDGVLVNIDGNGNRVAAITFGPKHVIFVVGLNKVTQDVASALARARSTASRRTRSITATTSSVWITAWRSIPAPYPSRKSLLIRTGSAIRMR